MAVVLLRRERRDAGKAAQDDQAGIGGDDGGEAFEQGCLLAGHLVDALVDGVARGPHALVDRVARGPQAGVDGMARGAHGTVHGVTGGAHAVVDGVAGLAGVLAQAAGGDVGAMGIGIGNIIPKFIFFSPLLSQKNLYFKFNYFKLIYHSNNSSNFSKRNDRE